MAEQLNENVVAYHEAGHAVIRWALNVGLTHISVRAFDGIVTGAAIMPDFDPTCMSRSDWTRLEKTALVLLAGEFSERAYNELQGCHVDDFLSADDRSKLAELLERLGEHECPPIDLSRAALESKADKLVVKYWNQIDALAEALLIQGEMNENEAIRIIESIDC
jgi:hypothetical protein